MKIFIKLNLYFFLLKRESYYHKIQYSKVFKHDISAAILGVVFGAFVVYLSLNTLGSGSPDLSDLSTLLWYIFLVYMIILKYSNLSYYKFSKAIVTIFYKFFMFFKYTKLYYGISL